MLLHCYDSISCYKSTLLKCLIFPTVLWTLEQN